MQRGRVSSAFARLNSDNDSTSSTSRCSGWRSTDRRSCPGLRWRRACATSTKRLPAALEGEATIPISSAWACCFLVSACTTVLDYDRASEWCDRIADFADRYGSRYMLAFCRAEYGAVHLWRGSWSDAEALLVASIEDYSGSRPAWVGSPLVVLADLRRRQGKSDEAALLLDQAGTGPSAQLSRAALALDGGDSLRARRASRTTAAPAAGAPEARPCSGPRTAHPSTNCPRGARRGGGEPRGIFGKSSTWSELPPLRAFAERAEGMLAAAQGEHERARPLLEDAVDGFEKSGAPFEAAPDEDRACDEPLWRWAAPMWLSERRSRARGAPARLGRGNRGRARASSPRASGRGGITASRRDAPRARRASSARRRAYESPDRRPPGDQRAHGPPPRDEHPAQARPPIADGRRRPRRSLRPARHIADRLATCRCGEDGRFRRSRIGWPRLPSAHEVGAGTRKISDRGGRPRAARGDGRHHDYS